MWFCAFFALFLELVETPLSVQINDFAAGALRLDRNYTNSGLGQTEFLCKEIIWVGHGEFGLVIGVGLMSRISRCCLPLRPSEWTNEETPQRPFHTENATTLTSIVVPLSWFFANVVCRDCLPHFQNHLQ